MLAFVPRVLMCADVPPGPAVESAFLHVRDVVGDEFIAERIAFVHRTPQLASLGFQWNFATGVANAVGVDAPHACLGSADKDVGSILFVWTGIGIVDV